jgi:sirohydrochlorin cobaltochelatase
MNESHRFVQAELILAGHGSTQNPDSSRPVYQHAAELRRRGLFAHVSEAFWKQPPFLRDVWSQVRSSEVFVVPLMISDGYFTTEVIPHELGLIHNLPSPFARVQSLHGRTVRYTQPIGTHPRITALLLARAYEALAPRPGDGSVQAQPEATSLFIAGHGTPRNKRSRQSVEHQVECIRASGAFAEVHAVFMEEKPYIGEVYQIARASDVVVVPFFVSDGLHVQEDIPALLGESQAIIQERLSRRLPVWSNPTHRAGKRIWFTAGVGTDPRLADLILDQVRNVASCSPRCSV